MGSIWPSRTFHGTGDVAYACGRRFTGNYTSDGDHLPYVIGHPVLGELHHDYRRIA
jgi:hypothetical protein